MSDPEKLPFDTMSEAEFEPILQLLQGGNPDAIARRAGITKEQLFQMRDALLAQAEHQKAIEEDVVLPKVGRNEPCPCGSGKKYKNCCLRYGPREHKKAPGKEKRTGDTY
jgi:uncharacterized protein YecA (UPF0149 family)